MKYVFICPVEGIELTNNYINGFEIYNGLKISSSTKPLDRMLNSWFIRVIGTLEMENLRSSTYFYLEGEVDDETYNDTEKAMDLLNYHLEAIQLFGNITWLKEDNSINTDNGYLFIMNASNPVVHSNRRDTHFYNQVGRRTKITLRKKDLDFISTQMRTTNLHFSKDYSDDDYLSGKISADRISRAVYLVQKSRSHSHLPDRISDFVTVLECMMSFSNSEVTHKLKERVAWLLGENYEQRQEIFDDLDMIYKIRSFTVHGNVLPKKAKSYDVLVKNSEMVEKYVREIINSVLSNKELFSLYELSDREIEAWYNSLVLGKYEVNCKS